MIVDILQVFLSKIVFNVDKDCLELIYEGICLKSFNLKLDLIRLYNMKLVVNYI